MRIMVCAEYVPDVQSERRIGGGRLVRDEGDILNEFGENAVEAVIALTEEADGKVIALTMGPGDVEDGARRTPQMGADSGVVVADNDLANADVVTTARVLATAIRRIGKADLVVTGMAPLDSVISVLPDALIATLHPPAVTLANRLEVDGGAVAVIHTVGTAHEVLSAPLPTPISVTGQASEPCYLNSAAMRAVKEKPIDLWDASCPLYTSLSPRVWRSFAG